MVRVAQVIHLPLLVAFGGHELLMENLPPAAPVDRGEVVHFRTSRIDELIEHNGMTHDVVCAPAACRKHAADAGCCGRILVKERRIGRAAGDRLKETQVARKLLGARNHAGAGPCNPFGALFDDELHEPPHARARLFGKDERAPAAYKRKNARGELAA